MFNLNLNELIISDNISVIDALRKINDNGKQIVFVCRDCVLLATVTDGDVRRFILNKQDLNENVMTIANRNPIFIYEKDIADAEMIFRRKHISAIPVVNNRKELINVLFVNNKIENSGRKFEENIPIVIMAGGKGTRLAPYTDFLPKPLVSVNGKPIVEHIMEHFEYFGGKDFHFIINYKKEFMKAYFVDSKYNIAFHEEDDYLGTAGGLSLLKGKICNTFFVSNCDILIECDYTNILKTHEEQGNIITIVCANKEITIPYGIFEFNESGHVENLKEKPKYDFIINTGMYVCESEILNEISDNSFIHITDVIQKLIACGEKVGVYTVDENKWIDLGSIDEFKKMQSKLQLV